MKQVLKAKNGKNILAEVIYFRKRVIGDYLQDILDAIVAIEEFVESITIDKFKQDRKTILLLQEQLNYR